RVPRAATSCGSGGQRHRGPGDQKHGHSGGREADGQERDVPGRPYRLIAVRGRVDAEESHEEHRLGRDEDHHGHHGAAALPAGPLLDDELVLAHPSPPPGAAATRASYTGRTDRILGRVSKLWGGGGEDVAHSSVSPCH